jgi:AcrR family transcriptional regulator
MFGTEGVRQRALRSDSIRNRRAIIDTLEAILREGEEEATMSEVTRRSGFSPATVYRYFPTLKDLHKAFLLQIIEELYEQTQELEGYGAEKFEAILAIWLKVVERYGPAMVFARSKQGFMTRFYQGEPHVMALYRVWGQSIEEMLVEHDLPPESFPYAFMLYNSILNSREILDLQTATELSDGGLVRYFSTVFQSALEGMKSVELWVPEGY